jgi:hypothetical protein
MIMACSDDFFIKRSILTNNPNHPLAEAVG